MPITTPPKRWLAMLLIGVLAPSMAIAAELPPHPRLIATADELASIPTRAGTDPLLSTLRDATIATSEEMQTQRTCEYRIPDGRRLLMESRRALDTILHTSLAWRLTGDRRHFERCVKELDAACGLADWHPPHFLDTAEMATAVAIGLDWLHDDLDAAQRARYRDALVAKAIVPARQEFERKAPWTRVNNNWSQVCGTGIALACLAAAGDAADLESSPWRECLRVVAGAGRFYEPDGCYPEGPGYWNYGTNYHVVTLATLESLGHPEPLPKPLLLSAAFMAHARGPTGTMFNFADAHPVTDACTAARSWLAARSKDPALVADLRRQMASLANRLAAGGSHDRFFPLHLLWLPPEPEREQSLPLAAAFQGDQPVAMFRTSWNDPNALFVAVKGGTPKASHAHMDVGSFIVEALGRRWIHDLGSDDYNLPGYFRDERFSYFRVNSRSHNVLSVDGALQNATSQSCGLVAATSRPPFEARLDLSPAYAARDGRLAESVTRVVGLDSDSRTIHIRDTITAPVGPVRWQAAIDVEPILEGNRAILADGDRGIELVINTLPAPMETRVATWKSEPARPASPREATNDGFHLLSCTVSQAPQISLEVTIRPRATPSLRPAADR